VAVGNVVGSNVFNVAAILGLAALIRPLRIRRETLRAEWPVMMGAAVALALMIQDAVVSRAEGALLCLGLVAFIAWAARSSARHGDEGGDDADGGLVTASFGRTGARAVATNLGAVAAGVAALAGGSHLLVRGAVTLATGLGVSELVVGLTVVAAGTSAPELVTSLVASWRGRDDIAVGNVVGSNVFNVLCIMGATAAITPVPVPAEVLSRDVWWMLGVSAALLPLALTGMRIQRVEGAALFAAFVAYTASLLV
jgi:cation:H+ antiporter